MIGVAAVPSAAGAPPGVAEPSPPAGDLPPVLPEPAPDALAGADPLSMLYLFESQDQQLGVASGTSRIVSQQADNHQALQQEQEAIQKAVDAAKNKTFWDGLGGVLGDVAKVAAVVASVAAAIATGGAGAPVALAVAGAVLSAASFADGEFHVLRALGVDESTAGWIDTALAVGGMVGSVGAGVVAGGHAASGALSALKQTAAAVDAVGKVGTGVSHIESAHAQAASDQAAAEEVGAQARSDHAQRLMQLIIDDTQTSDEEAQTALRAIIDTKTIQNQTTVSAATAVRG